MNRRKFLALAAGATATVALPATPLLAAPYSTPPTYRGWEVVDVFSICHGELGRRSYVTLHNPSRDETRHRDDKFNSSLIACNQGNFPIRIRSYREGRLFTMSSSDPRLWSNHGKEHTIKILSPGLGSNQGKERIISVFEPWNGNIPGYVYYSSLGSIYGPNIFPWRPHYLREAPFFYSSYSYRNSPGVLVQEIAVPSSLVTPDIISKIKQGTGSTGLKFRRSTT